MPSSVPVIFFQYFLTFSLIALVRCLPMKFLSRSWVTGAICFSGLMLAAFVFSRTVPDRPFEDFREAYWPAGAAVANGPDFLLPMLQKGVEGFVNLPIIAYLFWPFGLLPYKVAAVIFFLLGILASLAAWLLTCLAFRLNRRDTLTAAIMFATFGPLHYSLREGNISHFVLAAMLVAAMAASRRRDVLAGVLFGFLAVLKLPLLLIGVYFVCRGRYLVAMAGGLTVACLACLSVAVFGIDAHLVWYKECVVPFQAPLPAFNAQSYESALARLQLGQASLLDWTPHILTSGYFILAKALSGATVVLTLGAAVRNWIRERRGTGGKILYHEIFLVALATCLASPLSWSHYFVVVLPALALMLKDRNPPMGAASPVIVYVLLGLTMSALYWNEDSNHLPWNILMWTESSLLMLGTFLTWAALLVVAMSWPSKSVYGRPAASIAGNDIP